MHKPKVKYRASVNTPETTKTFAELGTAENILAVLETMKITVPTPIQHAAIPVALEGKDMLGIAQTGTGKTFAYSIPMLQRLTKFGGRALILVPTRELAGQVEESLRPIANMLKIGIAVFIGGASMHLQRQAIRRNPRILIATPGRLIDHLEQRTVTLREVAVLVLDEADRMLDMGFAPQLAKIVKCVPAERQTLLFSATMPHSVLKLATQYTRLPVRIEVAPAGSTAERVEQAALIMSKDDKFPVLLKLLGDYKGTVLVFVRTKHGAKKLTEQLNRSGHFSAEIHSNRSLAQRREALEGFKKGKYRILVATDIAARGIDVKDIELVVNFDLPDNPEEYVHRIGRTGRAGKTGQAISLATSDQRGDIKTIERLIRAVLPVSVLPSAASDMARPERSGPSRGGYRPRGGGGGGRSFRRGRPQLRR